MREEFVNNWDLSKNSSPKLEFYAKIKNKFEPEKYLSKIENSTFRESMTRYRISCHNLYVERGRYENPYVLREDRWCVHCYTHSGLKLVEDEYHVLLNCPLFHAIKSKNNFPASSADELIDMLSNQTLAPNKIKLVSKTIHEILTANESYTQYYKPSC